MNKKKEFDLLNTSLLRCYKISLCINSTIYCLQVCLHQKSPHLDHFLFACIIFRPLSIYHRVYVTMTGNKRIKRDADVANGSDRHKIVLAIDYGTTFTGTAIALVIPV